MNIIRRILHFHCKNEIVIGNHVNIGAGCLIMESNFHSLDWRFEYHRIWLCFCQKYFS